MMTPVVLVNKNVQRESGRKVQLGNIVAAKTVADVIRSCLGPSSMLKMLMDPMGGIVLTNDGHAILREIDVAHPMAKSMIELSRAQDEEVGDGTTSVIVLTGEILGLCGKYLEKNIHPVVLISGLRCVLDDGVKIMRDLSAPLDVKNDEEMMKIIRGTINTKFGGRWGDLMCGLALKAARIVAVPDVNGKMDVDMKRYARIEKIPGDDIESSRVIEGIVLNKDVTHPGMRRRIENPRIVLLDCALEYKKGESMTNLELTRDEDWSRVLEIEEEQIKDMCEKIISVRPDLVFTEKGVSDIAQHYLVRANITAIRRIRKTDNHRLAKAVGAKIVNRVDDIKESDVGTKCQLFHIDKIGDEYFTFVEPCTDPHACSILLRGPSKDILNELERDLQDALWVARNLYIQPKMVPGGGALEMAVSVRLETRKKELASALEDSLMLNAYDIVSDALQIIPKTLLSNCGADVIRTLTLLRSKHVEDQSTFGVNGLTGNLIDMKEECGVWEPLAVKSQTLETAIEAACMVLRVDDMISGTKKSTKPRSGPEPAVVDDGQ